MSGPSTIEWTDATWNPVRGCTRVSPGCGGPGKMGGCYAEKIAARFSGPGQPFEGFAERNADGGRWTGKLALIEHLLTEPMRWKQPRKSFVNSMSDLFHESLPDEAIDKVLAVAGMADWHVLQILTKRADRMRAYMSNPLRRNEIELAAEKIAPSKGRPWSPKWSFAWPLPNVWLGVSAERQQEYDQRWPHLASTPAAVRFVSYEPALGPLNIRSTALVLDRPSKMFPDWVICGGESGSNARPMHPDWARQLRDECAEANVAFFFKQWGEWIDADARGSDMLGTSKSPLHKWAANRYSVRVGKKAAGRMLDGVEHNGFPVTDSAVTKLAGAVVESKTAEAAGS